MTRSVLPLTRILALISIIAFVLVFPACAADEDIIDVPAVEEVPIVDEFDDGAEVEVINEESEEEIVDTEMIEITADSGIIYEVLADTPLGRLAAAALEGEFAYVVSDELFESDEILTLVSLEVISIDAEASEEVTMTILTTDAEVGTWNVYEIIDEVETLIPNDELGTYIVTGDVRFVYVDESGEVAALDFPAPVVEAVVDEVVDEVVDTEVSDVPAESDETTESVEETTLEIIAE